ncbi:MAG: ABC transporter ATP-binding protein [Prevotella sp.]|jgi:ABC-type multidrug transport system ATPase subunit|nr:ABC transporter ATP-binding protein [Prevotella sp.]MCH3995271.1 ABC transporter ATP-binding protein [Prevotella sp.]
MSCIDVSDLRYKVSSGKEILSGVSFEVNYNDRIAVLGNNGAGKTSLFETMLGVVSPSSGRVTFDEELQNPSRIAAIWDSFEILPNFKVGELVKYFSLMYGGTPETAIFTLLKIEELKAKRMKYLSKGERKRVAIAVALMSHPKVLFSDELTSDLDKQTQDDVWKFLSDKGITTLFITHKWDEAKAYANQFLLIYKGHNIAPLSTEKQLLSMLPFDKKMVTENKDDVPRIADSFQYTEGERSVSLVSSRSDLSQYTKTNDLSLSEPDIYDVYRYLSSKEVKS